MAKLKEKSASNVFDGFETDIRDYTKKKTVEKVGAEKIELGPHTVRLSKGLIPDVERLNSYQLFCVKSVGRVVRARRGNMEGTKLETDLLKAHMKIGPTEFIAYVWMTSIICLIVGVILMVVMLGLTSIMTASALAIPEMIWILISIMPLLIPAMAFMVLNSAPSRMVKTRKNNIEKRLAYAMSFVSTMSSADVNVDVIFKELGKQVAYGEIQKEAQWITRDIELLGLDTLTALRVAANRSPSTKWQDFLQGVVTTTLSGGQLKPYFVLKTEQFAKENMMDAKRNMETLGMMAESFVVVVVALPLFLIIMMSLMGMMGGGGGGSSQSMLYVIVYAVIPVSQIGFIVLFISMTEEV